MIEVTRPSSRRGSGSKGKSVHWRFFGQTYFSFVSNLLGYSGTDGLLEGQMPEVTASCNFIFTNM